MQGVSLNLTSEDNFIVACPGTNVTVTCSAIQVGLLRWISTFGPLDYSFIPNYYATDRTRVVNNPFTLTLVNATSANGSVADLTSALEVKVNDIYNGTMITCQTFPEEISKSLTIFKKSKWFCHV